MRIRILLQDRLDERGLSQRKLHELTGIRLQTINEYTRELSDRINIEHIAKMCEVLDCGVSDILALYDDNGEPVGLPILRSDVDAVEVLQKMSDPICSRVIFPFSTAKAPGESLALKNHYIGCLACLISRSLHKYPIS